MKRFLRLRRQEQGGFTLVEVTLTSLILGIVVLLAFDFLDRVSLLTMRTQANAQTEQDAQLALRTVSQHLRGAYAVQASCSPTLDGGSASTSAPGVLPTGYDNCIHFTVKRTETGIDECAQTEFVFAIVGTGTTKKLIENRKETTGVSGSCTTPATWRGRRVLLEKVANTSTEPLFAYYAASGAPIAVTDTAGVKKASSVHIRLDVQFHNNASKSVFTTSAALRNNVPR